MPDAPPDRARRESATPEGPPAHASGARDRIADAVIAVMAESGLDRLTHRRVAETAGVSLAATTYHYANRAEMVREASERLLQGYIDAFRRAALQQASGEGPRDLAAFIARIIVRGAGRDRQRTIAWCEIILDSARTADGRGRARTWFAELAKVWQGMFAAFGQPQDRALVQTAIDLAVGLLFVVLPLGLSPADLEKILLEGADLAEVWIGDASGAGSQWGVEGPLPQTGKARETRSRILGGAIGLLVEHGAGAISYRRIAEAAGLTMTAPAYYFHSIGALLRAAEVELFRASKARYRESIATHPAEIASIDGLADLTAATLIREATEFAGSSIALYSIWLEATRSSDLRSEIGAAVLAQTAAWRRRLGDEQASPSEGLALQAIFIGKLVRVVACGATMDLLASVPLEMRCACNEKIRGTFFQK